MTSITNPYDALYTNLKNRFTVIHDGTECSVGDYMRIKAGKKGETSLPASFTHEGKPISSVINYFADKLVLKSAPAKDKTIRRFPIRTSMSAALSAVASCALVISCGIFVLSNTNSGVYTAENNATYTSESIVEDYNGEIDLSETEYKNN